MILIFLLLTLALLIVLAGTRIVLGWILPVATVAAIDRAAGQAFSFLGKLSVVILAGLIVATIVLAFKQ